MAITGTGSFSCTIDALEAVRRLTLERDALAQQVTYLTIQAADRERLAEQVRRLHTEVGGQVADLRIIAAERDTLAARVKRIQAHLNMLIKERDEAVLRANHAENALQAPVRSERHETGTEPTEGTNGAPEGGGAHKKPARQWNLNRRTDGRTEWRYIGDRFDAIVSLDSEGYHAEAHVGTIEDGINMCYGDWRGPVFQTFGDAAKHAINLGEQLREDACGDWEGK